MIYPADERMERNCWEDGKSELRNIVLTMRKDIELDEDSSCGSVSEEINSTEIFIVHGHDDAMKLDVARTLEKLDYKPIILHEQPDKGRNILNKLIEESDNCGFAIILLSPDDYGYSKETDDSCKKMRARQNVILELGYFLGKLKTDRVVALYKDDPNFEIPSDFVGTLYKKYDASGSWRYELAKELKAAGYTIDANKLIE